MYPEKPIRLIVPFPPGGPSDLMARMLAQKLTETFAQAVVVDNRPGGGGTMGVETAVRAHPDGYTMVLVTASYAANGALYKLPYDPVTDVTPVALIGENGLVVALHPSVPITSIKELIAYDKAHPGKLNYGSSGTGFRVLRYEEDIGQAGDLLSRIADVELNALAQMERGWEVVQKLPKDRAARRFSKVA